MASPGLLAQLRRLLGGVETLVRFGHDPLELLTELHDEGGDLVELDVLGTPWFLLSDPADIEAALVHHAKSMGRDKYVVTLERTLGKGLLTSDGELWKRQRKLMAQAFTPRQIRAYVETMAEVGAEGLRWRPGETLNLHREMSRLTMEIVAAVLFGAGIGRAEVELVGEAMEAINAYYAGSFEAIAKLPSWVPTPLNRRVSAAIEQLDALIYRIIADRRRGEARDDLLGTLIAAVDEGGAGMSDQQLRDEAMTLFLAGHETTALALTHTLYLLALHPAVERRVLAELDEVLSGAVPSVAELERLEYTRWVLDEAMRLYPPVWVTGRELVAPVEIGGRAMPVGAQLVMSEWVVHRDRRWFPDPEAFDPERWSPARRQGVPRYAYFPFGGGPRVCIGSHFALLEAKLLLALILPAYHLELVAGQRLEFEPSVTLRPKGEGLQVRVRERERG